MFAIAFDLDTQMLAALNPRSPASAYGDIRRIMEQDGFMWVQGSLYYGTDTTTKAACAAVVERLALLYPWFGRSVRDIRLLAIAEEDDLRDAIPEWDRVPRFSEWWRRREKDAPQT